MELFRGDKIYNNITEPGKFRNNGIRTKAFGGESDPSNIERKGLLDTIRMHIKPESESDRKYYNVTDYLSFSESYDRAKYWCSDQNTLELISANDFYETRYIFRLVIENSQLEEIGNGIYLFHYKCNVNLKTSDSGNSISEAILQLSYDKIEGCPICKELYNFHYLILIDSVKYLNNYKEQDACLGALQNSEKDREWLVLPYDLIDSNHRTTRIPRADFWNVDLFKVIGEIRPIF